MKISSLQRWRLATLAGAALLASGAMAADSLQDVMKKRAALSQQDLLAAAKTYVPTGKRDEFVAFSSGGQSGQVIVYAIPSMRILKYIGVFTPEPWQGYGYDEDSKAVLRQGLDQWQGASPGAIRTTRRSPRPTASYDGQFLFINDKANPRIAVIDLRDFETKQIVANPIFMSEHGGTFVTPNSEYVVEATQYPAPAGQEVRARWRNSTISTAAA
jgi:nitrous-oxide reductase